jgi:cobalt-zinc-cadmium efflux system membrane fusion protein
VTRWILGVLGAGALSSGACSGHAASTSAAADALTMTADAVVLAADSPMLKQIRCQPVAVENLPTDDLVTPGKLEANPNRVSKLLLPVAGRITSVLVKTGDRVTTDQPLLTVQSPDADAALSAYVSARAIEAQAEVALEKARADSDRAADLFAHDAVAQKDVQAAVAALAQAQAAVEQARASRDQSLRRLQVLGLAPDGRDQQVIVRAPLPGKVLDLSVVPGEFRNDTTTPLMTIADLSTVWITSQVPETSIRFVRPGQAVAISLIAYPGETFEGRVSRVADTVDPQTRAVKVQAELDNHDGRLRPEMFGSVHHVQTRADMAVIPAAAIVHSGEKTVVFVQATPGRFERREVAIGVRSGDVVRVMKGVSPGDAVVVDGAMLLQGLLKRTSR